MRSLAPQMQESIRQEVLMSAQAESGGTKSSPVQKTPHLILADVGEKGFASTQEFLEKREKSKLGQQITEQNKLN
jgi:hypothetical protein